MQLVTMKVKDVKSNDDNPPERTDRNNRKDKRDLSGPKKFRC